MNKQKSYESIFSIVNKDFTDIVMEAARKASARGGTILDAKASSKINSKFFSEEANANKEIVMIVVESKIKNKVLKSIYEAAGLSTGGEAIVFSLPVTSIVGINKVDAYKK